MDGGENIFVDRSEQEDEQRLREVMCERRVVSICCHDSPHDEAVDPPVRPFHTVSEVEFCEVRVATALHVFTYLLPGVCACLTPRHGGGCSLWVDLGVLRSFSLRASGVLRPSGWTLPLLSAARFTRASRTLLFPKSGYLIVPGLIHVLEPLCDTTICIPLPRGGSDLRRYSSLLRGRPMQDPANDLRRISLPRTPVNRSKREIALRPQRTRGSWAASGR
jgi:hypothetical protein